MLISLGWTDEGPLKVLHSDQLNVINSENFSNNPSTVKIIGDQVVFFMHHDLKLFLNQK